MALWIVQNQYGAKVLADLRAICPDPGLTVDGAGKVSYAQTMSDIGCDTIAMLDSGTLRGTPIAGPKMGAVSMRAEASGWTGGMFNGAEALLRNVCGINWTGVGSGILSSDIVYDGGDCDGRGWFTLDPQGVLGRAPGHVVLFHELRHVALSLLGGATADVRANERLVIEAENAYRASRGFPLRSSSWASCAGDHSPGPVMTPARCVPAAVCTPLLMSSPYVGTGHTLPLNALRAEERPYHVNINNQATDTFTKIVVMYKSRLDELGVRYLRAEHITPGEVTGFMLGLCKDLVSYNVGFFLPDPDLPGELTMVAQIPETGGTMTPALASQLNPTDADPCIDSWQIID